VRIAEIAPVWYSVPPEGYGGIELVVSLLADGLVERGHDVTLFASGRSLTKATLVSQFDPPPPSSELGDVWYDAEHVLGALLDCAEFDVVHDHSGVVGPAMGALVAALVPHAPPIVHTLHGPWTPRARRFYGFLQDRVHLVAISDDQRAANPDVRYAGRVHNGIDLSAYELVEDKEDFLVYIGRASPEKAPALAIEVARRAGLPLAMIVKRNEPPERAYWDEVVTPALHDGVEVFEHVTHKVKAELLGRARALVLPIQWPEPFGLVMVEAMACGTPVVACPAGAAPELVVDGETGFLRHDVEGLAAAVGRAGELSPRACRRRAVERFSAPAMVAGYEAVFGRITAARVSRTRHCGRDRWGR